MQQPQQPHLQPQQQVHVSARGSRPDFRFAGNEPVTLDDQTTSATAHVRINSFC